MKTTQLRLNLWFFFCLTGSAVVRRCGGVKNEISGEGSFLQMLHVLRKGKTDDNEEFAAGCLLSRATLMQKCNNDLSKNIPRAKRLHTAQRTNRIKNYPPCGRYIHPPADSDPLLTDGFGDPRIWCWAPQRITYVPGDGDVSSSQLLRGTDAVNKEPWPSGLLDDGCVAPGTGAALVSQGGLCSPCLRTLLHQSKEGWKNMRENEGPLSFHVSSLNVILTHTHRVN